jgi:hypothetical protein
LAQFLGVYFIVSGRYDRYYLLVWNEALNTRRSFLAACFSALAPMRAEQPTREPWTIYITNDSCSDYTWNNTEQDTLHAYAEIIRAHLDEMIRSDHEQPENQERYNLSITGEALSFFNLYPERKDEFISRVKEGRISFSPFLNNSLLAFQSTESAIRNFYPALRMQREWGLPLEVAEHIECPSLPWGMASLLAGCGVRWLSVPFLDYDSTFKGLEVPPLFIWEGTDGTSIRVILDKFASEAFGYSQGGRLLKDASKIETTWLPHYESLGDAYPLRIALASGTHNDLYLRSTRQVVPFHEAIRSWNMNAANSDKLINATLPQFCSAVDTAQEGRPFLKNVRGCFGHSWDLWPLTTAKYASGMRVEGTRFVDMETFATVVSSAKEAVLDDIRPAIGKAEWAWTMLSDHAWNGASEANRRENSSIRRNWLADLERANDSIAASVWQALEVSRARDGLTVFNPVSFERAGLMRIEGKADGQALTRNSLVSPLQIVEEDSLETTYSAVSQQAGFSLSTFSIVKSLEIASPRLHASDNELQGPFYKLRVDPLTGGLASVVHQASGGELLPPGSVRTIGQTVFHDGQEHPIRDFASKVLALGSVLARLQITGSTADIRHRTFVTIYADLDRIDFDFQIDKPVSTRKQRLCHVFPVVHANAVLRAETTGAVIRPFAQPKGDFLPGADTGRLAVQGFVDASIAGGFGVTVVPVEAFALRLDLDPLSFEVLGNDQNYQESVRDQNRETEFRFRYSLRAHNTGWHGESAAAFSRSVSSPLLAAWGGISSKATGIPVPKVQSNRAIALAFKPADDPKAGGHILRLWEHAGESGPLRIAVPGYGRAFQTDLLERNQAALAISGGEITVPLTARGFASIRLLPA